MELQPPPQMWTDLGRRAEAGDTSLIWKPARDQWAKQREALYPDPRHIPPRLACSLEDQFKAEMG